VRVGPRGNHFVHVNLCYCESSKTRSALAMRPDLQGKAAYRARLTASHPHREAVFRAGLGFSVPAERPIGHYVSRGILSAYARPRPAWSKNSGLPQKLGPSLFSARFIVSTQSPSDVDRHGSLLWGLARKCLPNKRTPSPVPLARTPFLSRLRPRKPRRPPKPPRCPRSKSTKKSSRLVNRDVHCSKRF
jgi:hypothetical protein